MMSDKDDHGQYSYPSTFSLSDCVLDIMMDLSPQTRDHVEVAVKQAMENPEDFIRYVIITLGDCRQQLNSVISHLAHEGIITLEEEDNAPSA